MITTPTKDIPQVVTREFVLARRKEWIDFLKRPETKKGSNALDWGNSERCCLGHGCHLFKDYLTVEDDPDDGYSGAYTYNLCDEVAPAAFKRLVGLFGELGEFQDPDNPGAEESSPGQVEFRIDDETRTFSKLAMLNDMSDFTPQQIGAWLETVIVGGPRTPFIPLSNYPSEAAQ